MLGYSTCNVHLYLVSHLLIFLKSWKNVLEKKRLRHVVTSRTLHCVASLSFSRNAVLVADTMTGSEVMTSQNWLFPRTNSHVNNRLFKQHKNQISRYQTLLFNTGSCGKELFSAKWDPVKLHILYLHFVMLVIRNFAHVLTATVSITWFEVRMEKFANWWRHSSVLWQGRCHVTRWAPFSLQPS